MEIDKMTAPQIIEYYLRRALPPSGEPVRVRFLASHLPYSTGDVATFPARVAEQLVRLGAAEFLEGQP